MTRIIGLDHGTRRIGVAVGDTETRLALARDAITARSLHEVTERIEVLCANEGVDLLVIGLPLHADGSEGDQATRARAFGAALERIGLAVTYEDERLTSWEAGERLAGAGRRPHRSSGELDSAAARLILQQYLDALPATPSHDPDPAKETA